MHVYIDIYMCMFVCMCMRVCVYICTVYLHLIFANGLCGVAFLYDAPHAGHGGEAFI